MRHSLRFDGPAKADLKSIAEWIAGEAGFDIAFAYIDRIEAACLRLADFPRHGRLRRRGSAVRSIPFRRSATILYRVANGEVLILRVLHSGRDIARDIVAIG